jgi:hypothetical protein
MQVVLRSLLAATLVASAASCALNEHGLDSADAGRIGAAGAGPSVTGAAGAPAGAAGDANTTGTGVGGAAGSTPMITGAAGSASSTAGAAGSSTGAAGSGAAGHPTATTGAGGAAGTTGASGATAGASGTGGGAQGGAGGAGTAAAGAGGGAAGSGSTNPDIGCSDGTREGYLDLSMYPQIAACAGGWDEPGLISTNAKTPLCDRRGGNDGDKPDGRGCSAADLCAAGWHVCLGVSSVANVLGGCADAIAPYGDHPVFFATAQRAQGLVCSTNGQGMNNVYGCGTIGSTPDRSCEPLDRFLHDSDCANNPPWSCSNGPLGTSQSELDDVTKSGPERGGVLCCAN